MKIKTFFEEIVSNNKEFSDYLHNSLNQDKIIVTRRTAYVASMLVTIFALVDILSGTEHLFTILLIRAIMVIAITSNIYLSYNYKQYFLDNYPWIVPSVYLVNGFGILAMIYLSENEGVIHSTYFAGIMLIIIAMFAWVYLNTLIAITGSFILTIGYCIVFIVKVGVTEQSINILLNNLIFLLGSISFGLVADILRKHYLFKNFLTQKKLKQFLLPLSNKPKVNRSKINKSEFIQLLNNGFFDARVASLKLILIGVSIDASTPNLNYKNELYKLFGGLVFDQVELYTKNNIVWGFCFTDKEMEAFKEDLELLTKDAFRNKRNEITLSLSSFNISLYKAKDIDTYIHRAKEEFEVLNFKNKPNKLSVVQ